MSKDSYLDALDRRRDDLAFQREENRNGPASVEMCEYTAAECQALRTELSELRALQCNGFDPIAAARAYPELVAALRTTQEHLDARQTDTGLDIIRQRNTTLLAKLGEAAP